MWTIQEACNHLGLNLVKARGFLARSGDKPPLVLRTNGGVTYYNKSALITFLNSHKDSLHV